MKLNFEQFFGEGNATLTPTPEGILTTGRTLGWSSPACDIFALLPHKNGYRGSCRIKSPQATQKVSLYIKIIYDINGNAGAGYVKGAMAEVGADWQTLTVETLIPACMNVSSLILYTVQAGEGPFTDLLFDNFEAEAFDGAVAKPGEKKNRNKRNERSKIGAIRWDAYFSVDDEYDVSRQVARSLSPREYHYRTPYFAHLTDEGGVTFGEPTQEQFDEEAALALEAGIDFFAYCWYTTTMKYARVQHRRSPYRDRLKMCAILHVGSTDFDELTDCMKDDCYLLQDGKPVVFIFGAGSASDDLLRKTIESAQKAGYESAYLVAMTGSDPLSITSSACAPYDALSAYSFGPNGAGEPFASLTARCEAANQFRFDLCNGLDVIPQITCGFDFRPRIDHPVSWMGGNWYSLRPTEEELYVHASHVLKSLREHPDETTPNMALIYAWNEHDEGGWFCPCLSETGERDQTHYRAIAKAVLEHKAQEK